MIGSDSVTYDLQRSMLHAPGEINDYRLPCMFWIQYQRLSSRLLRLSFCANLL